MGYGFQGQGHLGTRSKHVTFVERSFKEEDWSLGLGPFHCVVTNQAIHELRHKHYASRLHTQVRSLLAPGGLYLVCDHFAGEG
jgi:predicted methyltransferase